MSSSRLNNSQSTVDLMFINISEPQDIKNRKTQQKINRHVMKPIGLCRRGDRQNQKVELAFKPDRPGPQHSESANRSTQEPLNNLSPDDQRLQSLSASAASRHLLAPAPSLSIHKRPSSHTMTAWTSKMLHFLAAAPESPVCALMRELCFTLAFIDDGALHLVLARLEIDPQRNGGQRSRENPYSLSHYNASIRVVKDRLDNAGLVVHEAIIGVVVNLASYDLFTDNFTRWKMHMLGLQKMIQYRGGIHSLNSRYLRVTATWTDLVGSMAIDQVPYFALDQADPTKARHVQDSAFKESLNVLQKNYPDSAGITVILNLLLSLSKLVAGKSELGLSQDLALMETLHAIVYTTLTLPRCNERAIHGDDPLTPIEATYEAFRLAVILYLSGPVMFVAGNKFSNPVASHLSWKLSKLLKAHIIDWTGLEQIELFVLSFGAVTEIGCGRNWMIVQLNHTMVERGLRWNVLMDNLRSMAWVDIVWLANLNKLGSDLTHASGS